MAEARIPLDLTSLELLVAVAETGSLGRAARQQGVSQPAASQRMQALERRLGVTLVDRSPTGSVLTEAGATVVDWARPLLDSASALGLGIAALREKGPRGRLRVAASLTIADHLVPGWLLALDAGGGGPVALRVAGSDEVASLVAGGKADIGFVEGGR